MTYVQDRLPDLHFCIRSFVIIGPSIRTDHAFIPSAVRRARRMRTQTLSGSRQLPPVVEAVRAAAIMPVSRVIPQPVKANLCLSNIPQFAKLPDVKNPHTQILTVWLVTIALLLIKRSFITIFFSLFNPNLISFLDSEKHSALCVCRCPKWQILIFVAKPVPMIRKVRVLWYWKSLSVIQLSKAVRRYLSSTQPLSSDNNA